MILLRSLFPAASRTSDQIFLFPAFVLPPRAAAWPLIPRPALAQPSDMHPARSRASDKSVSCIAAPGRCHILGLCQTPSRNPLPPEFLPAKPSLSPELPLLP